MRGSDVKEEFFFDRNRNVKISGIKTVFPGEETGVVDAIVVTPFLEYEMIKKTLREFYSCDIISIESVLLNVDCELMKEITEIEEK